MDKNNRNIANQYYEKIDMLDYHFPMVFHSSHFVEVKGSSVFLPHWHEKVEILFFQQGNALIKCNLSENQVAAGDIVVVNSNELHEGISLCDSLRYQCLIVDVNLIKSRLADMGDIKYLNPISDNRILFHSLIQNNTVIPQLFSEISNEYQTKGPVYELALKGLVIQIFTELLRNHVKTTLSSEEFTMRKKNLQRMNELLSYISQNYSQKITVEELAAQIDISKYHLCHQFKEFTGHSIVSYIHSIRVYHAEMLMRTSGLNVTEISYRCGFNDSNYFIRIFRKYRGITPGEAIRKYQRAY